MPPPTMLARQNCVTRARRAPSPRDASSTSTHAPLVANNRDISTLVRKYNMHEYHYSLVTKLLSTFNSTIIGTFGRVRIAALANRLFRCDSSTGVGFGLTSKRIHNAAATYISIFIVLGVQHVVGTCFSAHFRLAAEVDRDGS